MPSLMQSQDSERLIKDHEYVREANAQKEWLNWVFAVTTMGLALTCLQFKSPQRPALLCLFIIVPMYCHAFQNIPPSLRALKDLKRETNDPRVISELNYLQHKYPVWREIPRHVAFLTAPAIFFTVLVFGNLPLLSWFQK
ncbi:hypothetical protein LPB67_04935 [Undibacterium sp. Jales W-56]|uniref:hypothetical protein n=1 Tax=Undibacterium sp. Jales W-56 TaxID=2897325 RepID=UPI0021CE9B68|nr:hypothetical protein [Undibacterium sp. Jales W-56]MCU6433119.1 hypothetical protein [Undibacterium sp. Jales W-56]